MPKLSQQQQAERRQQIAQMFQHLFSRHNQEQCGQVQEMLAEAEELNRPVDFAEAANEQMAVEKE